MAKSKQDTITVQGTEVVLYSAAAGAYVSLTDIARHRNAVEPFSIINNWMRSRATIEFIGLWEKLNNPAFKPIEFERFRMEAGSNSFVLSPQRWIASTNAIGIVSKSGRYGGTYAHVDIAFEFASWISSEFKLYLITEFKRLKIEESGHQRLEWSLRRTISKINYRIHTDAISERIIPAAVTKEQAAAIYASEADLLNVALFGKTAAQWRAANPALAKKENIRDGATLEQLVVLSNMESINALLIRQGLSQSERLVQLNTTAIAQMKSLLGASGLKRLK
ncbi:hypothetical protein M2447_000029 [Ereboglobus sp. PH5-10]|uniref:KilA-N domain-containing protein n=1 Tax=Ereboglobus sp. PH5-10 TaxID=2940629 RepID=UPI002404A0AA|nr:KilA-N domain-containing protein [Ereboglobus sp. PH5-10]MDF9825953.1 hypothetical protein [Ereboglobus sp. PH5-10]